MDFSLSAAAQDTSNQMWTFMREEVFPAEPGVDGAIEVHGGAGVSDDTPLAYFYAWARVLRIVDGPDAVHRRAIARQELRRERPYTG